MHTTTIEEHAIKALIDAYLDAQLSLKKSKIAFEIAERDLIAEIGHKPEGTFSLVLGEYKVTTTGKINRTINADRWSDVAAELPAPIANRLVSMKPHLNVRELKFMRNNEPSIYQLVSQAITSKPAKTSLKVERVTPPPAAESTGAMGGDAA